MKRNFCQKNPLYKLGQQNFKLGQKSSRLSNCYRNAIEKSKAQIQTVDHGKADQALSLALPTNQTVSLYIRFCICLPSYLPVPRIVVSQSNIYVSDFFLALVFDGFCSVNRMRWQYSITISYNFCSFYNQISPSNVVIFHQDVQSINKNAIFTFFLFIIDCNYF